VTSKVICVGPTDYFADHRTRPTLPQPRPTAARLARGNNRRALQDNAATTDHQTACSRSSPYTGKKGNQHTITSIPLQVRRASHPS